MKESLEILNPIKSVTLRTRLEFLFGTEIFGFCALMKVFSSGIAVATVGGKDKIRVQNVKIAGKRETQDEF